MDCEIFYLSPIMPHLIIALLLLALAAYGQQNTFADARDGKKYKSVKIGTQTWMAENLNYEVKGFFVKGVNKCYENKESNCDKYGRLYDWNTAKTACPKGWHLPSKEEWETLTAAIGGEKTEGKHLKAKSGWNKDGNGLDSYGFSALPGSRGKSDGNFSVSWQTRQLVEYQRVRQQPCLLPIYVLRRRWRYLALRR